MIPDDLYMDDETTTDEQAYSSGEEVGRDHITTVNLRQSWWKPLTEDRPASPEPAWTIPSSDLPIPTNNWASTLKTTYVPPPENSSIAQDRSFHPDVVHLQFQMEECHKLLTDKVDDAILKYNVSKPLPLGGEPGSLDQASFPMTKRFSLLTGQPLDMKLGLSDNGRKTFSGNESYRRKSTGHFRDGIKILDEEDVVKMQESHVRYPETAKDMTYLPEARELCKYGDSDGYTFDDPILILEILSRRFLLRGIYLITGSSKDGDGDTSFQWSQFTTQCSHLMFPSKDIMTTE
ncbi:hypothetical protein Tco_0488629 [Tanacetum coccineum]